MFYCALLRNLTFYYLVFSIKHPSHRNNPFSSTRSSSSASKKHSSISHPYSIANATAFSVFPFQKSSADRYAAVVPLLTDP